MNKKHPDIEMHEGSSIIIVADNGEKVILSFKKNCLKINNVPKRDIDRFLEEKKKGANFA